MSRILRGPVTFDAKSFLVGGRRVWLHVGEIHYFRFPCELWEETLRRAKAAGLNTISTYVPWNFHAPEEGQVDFTGDRDLARYLDLIQRLDMYAIVRPGPYICSEWDGGGIPAWVLNMPGIETRDDDPVFMAYTQRWFDQVLPLVIPRQLSHDGPVILVQNENEYNGGWNDSTRSYLMKINTMFRTAGIDVPIIACNCHGRLPSRIAITGSEELEDQFLCPDTVLTYNWGPGAEPIRELRRRQPDAPLLMTEYWAGPQVFWGKPITDYCPAPEYARGMLEFTSLGCQLTYYMFDGGTNFGYWAGRNIATSYESNYPVREGGMLSAKYYRLNPVNHFITQFGASLAESEEVVDHLGITVPTGTRLVVRNTPAGHLLFISDAGVRPVTTLSLPGGETLKVALPVIRALVLPLELDVLPGLRFESVNLGLLGKSEHLKAVLLWGVAGTEGYIRVNGQALTLTIPARRVEELTVDGFTVYVVDEALAGHTWFPDDQHIVFGADFAELSADGAMEIRCSEATDCVVVADGHTLAEMALPMVPPLPSVPALTDWRKLECPERMADGDAWLPLPDGPKSHEDIGRQLGYVWYRAEFDAREDAYAPLLAPLVSTRLTVYANGVYCGTQGELSRFVEFCGYRHPADALQQDQIMVPVKKGTNRLVFLSDHLGRWFNGKPDAQGLRGPVYLGAQRLDFGAAAPFPPAPISEEAFRVLYDKAYRRPEPLPGVDLAVEVPADTDAYLRLPSGLTHIAVSVDGRPVGAMPKAKYPFSAMRLPEWMAGKRVVIRVQCKASGEFAPCLEHITLFLAPRRNALQKWAWTSGGEWPDAAEMTMVSSTVATGNQPQGWEGLMPEQEHPVGSGAKPAYYFTTFAKPESDLPLFLDIGKLHKGQLFLNGRNLGRFWQVGGHAQGNGVQSRYYVPRPWLRASNTLAIFEEYGLPPQGVALTWGASGNQAIIRWQPGTARSR